MRASFLFDAHCVVNHALRAAGHFCLRSTRSVGIVRFMHEAPTCNGRHLLAVGLAAAPFIVRPAVSPWVGSAQADAFGNVSPAIGGASLVATGAVGRLSTPSGDSACRK